MNTFDQFDFEGHKLTPEDIEDLKAAGLNQSDIARLIGRTRQWVSKVKLSSEGYSKTDRERAREFFPWVVPAPMKGAYPLRMLRDHVEYMVTGYDKMAETEKGREKLYRLHHWYTMIRDNNYVLEYDPSIPPNEFSQTGGFAYRIRKPSDGKLLIRRNRHTLPLKPRALARLQMPPTIPKIKR